jgi:hypothetical protein
VLSVAMSIMAKAKQVVLFMCTFAVVGTSFVPRCIAVEEIKWNAFDYDIPHYLETRHCRYTL